MTSSDKILGDQRRDLLVKTLKQATAPISGRKLGEMTNVSRQVIVGDVTLLKAMGEPIMATNRGYIYMHPQVEPKKIEKVIVCSHTAEQTEEELNILVDNGVTVKDVKIEHPIYGDLTASVMVSNRSEVQNFIQNIQQTNASLLLELTEGIHLHTIIADNEQEIENAETALRKAGFLVE
ncbi:transcription repressor NadR [Sporosarcina pasteurii]|uniref:Predicted small molecule binding protein (Contains 3H domain) n=1 Tax=Sporosarcina pasteurii TaxID=1474 RepID=A0A380BMA5_SPOPA|nr:transcription repressor NadR [Sporosarcina pasteurii]MDS9470976.1 transcription repressor NadR [Sporosarcina pasteurii]QBQ05373.1 transcription repressor NadR [Sporosarcina pasteurii]SUJ03563.1 Predicted small molecule binding protein (contains 3H domain) [Sporosarcina pasteurii]